LSVILAVRGGFAAVRRTVRHLQAQTIVERIELILVWIGGEPDVPERALEGFCGYRLERGLADSTIAGANAAGVQVAAADVVAFAEDHCFPEPGWAEALLEAHARRFAAVGPEVVNANPGNAVSWCDYLIGYGPWMSPVPEGEVPFLPGHNSSYKRAELLEYGEKLEAMLESETVLHFDLTRRGRRLYVTPRARAAHLNFALWSAWLPVQFHNGRVFGASRAACWPVAKRAVYAAASPLIPAVRFWKIARELFRPNRPRHMLFRLIVPLSIGLVCDGAGQLAGYLAGSGRSVGKLAQFEHNRVRYIRPEDRRALEESDGATTRGATKNQPTSEQEPPRNPPGRSTARSTG
jgi:hypothetical protein